MNKENIKARLLTASRKGVVAQSVWDLISGVMVIFIGIWIISIIISLIP